jgi:hypothetical protein
MIGKGIVLDTSWLGGALTTFTSLILGGGGVMLELTGSS